MARVPLGELIPKLVDKWSFELLHKSKMGETQSMIQTAQIQFSRRGWGRIKPDAIQGRRWLEYAASRGDSIAHASLQNLRTMLSAREHELVVAREYGLIDLTKRGVDGKIVPPSEQVKLPPLNFSRIVTHNPTNNLEATSEEEALTNYAQQHYKPLSQTLKEHKQKLLSQGKTWVDHNIPEPVDYTKLERKHARDRNQGLKEVSSQVQKELRKRVESGQLPPESAAKQIQQLQVGEHHMDVVRKSREKPSVFQQPSSTPQFR